MRIAVMVAISMLVTPATFAANDKPGPDQSQTAGAAVQSPSTQVDKPGKPEQTPVKPVQTPSTRVEPRKPMEPSSAVSPANASTRSPNKPAHTAFNDPANRGQVVSDCNHRANDRELIGHDRQDYVEWCTSRGHRYDRDYVDQYWNADRSCYGKADDRRMTGDRRTQFLRECLQRDDDRRYPPQ